MLSRIANGGLYQIETLENGQMKSISYTPDPIALNRITIEDGLIVSHPILGLRSVEWKATLIHPMGFSIDATVVAPSTIKSEAVEALTASSIVQALLGTGWIIQRLWLAILDDEF